MLAWAPLAALESCWRAWHRQGSWAQPLLLPRLCRQDLAEVEAKVRELRELLGPECDIDQAVVDHPRCGARAGRAGGAAGSSRAVPGFCVCWL